MKNGFDNSGSSYSRGRARHIIFALFMVSLLAAAPAAFAGMEHSHGGEAKSMQHEMKMPEGMAMQTLKIDDFKVTFHIMDRRAFREYMDNMGHTTHKMREGMTHYVMMDIEGKDGKKVARARVKLKIIGPGGKAGEKVAFPMMGNFGAEFDMTAKGEYQIMTLFDVGGEKHKGGFRYVMK